MSLSEQSDRMLALLDACAEGREISFRECSDFVSAEFLGTPSHLMIGRISAFRSALSFFYRTDIDIVSAAPGCLIVRFGVDTLNDIGTPKRSSSAAIYAPAIHHAMQECRVVRLSNQKHVAYVRSALRALHPPRDHWSIRIRNN